MEKLPLTALPVRATDQQPWSAGSPLLTREGGFPRSGGGAEGLLPAWAAGALAGMLATGPMSLVMQALFRRLPRQEQYPLPPRQITEEVAEKAGVEPALGGERGKRAATWLAHFGYGAAVGSLYPLTTGKLKLPHVVRGLLFGLVVWAGSYMGWLPAFNILPHATRIPIRRNALMVAAHLVWGTTIAGAVRLMRRTT